MFDPPLPPLTSKAPAPTLCVGLLFLSSTSSSAQPTRKAPLTAQAPPPRASQATHAVSPCLVCCSSLVSLDSSPLIVSWPRLPLSRVCRVFVPVRTKRTSFLDPLTLSLTEGLRSACGTPADTFWAAHDSSTRIPSLLVEFARF